MVKVEKLAKSDLAGSESISLLHRAGEEPDHANRRICSKRLKQLWRYELGAAQALSGAV
jgi:hypothetical protein